MSASGPALPLTMAMARDRIRQRCFRPGPTGRVGLELEWHVFDRADPQRIVPLDDLVELTGRLGPLPHGSTITFEPGGQLELSTPPADGVDAACAALAGDHDVVAAALAPPRHRPRGRRCRSRAGTRIASSAIPATTPWRRSSTSTAPPAGG